MQVERGFYHEEPKDTKGGEWDFQSADDCLSFRLTESHSDEIQLDDQPSSFVPWSLCESCILLSWFWSGSWLKLFLQHPDLVVLASFF